MFSVSSDIYGPNVFEIFVDQLGGPKRVHKFLDVSERTVLRWLSTGRVPRAAVLALYWETKYGRSQIFTDQVNEIRLLYRRVCILQEQYGRAKDIVAGLRRLHTGTANEAIFEELEDWHELPPNTYGEPASSSYATAQFRSDGQSQALVPKAGEDNPKVSARAKAAVAALDSLRRTASR